MVVELKVPDNRKLVEILKSKDFVTNPDKLQFIIESADLKTAVPAIDSAAEPDIRIWKVIKLLSEFGQDDYGHEALGRFLNYLVDKNKVSDRNEKDVFNRLI